MTPEQDDTLFSLDDCSNTVPDRVTRRRLSPKQAEIMDEVNREGSITIERATELVGGNLYHNAKKHTGALLANMVNIGFLARTSPGVFTKP